MNSKITIRILTTQIEGSGVKQASLVLANTSCYWVVLNPFHIYIRLSLINFRAEVGVSAPFKQADLTTG